MGRIVADQLQGVLVAIGDDRQRHVPIDGERGVHHATVDLSGQCGLGQPGAYIRGHLSDRHGMVEGPLGAVGKGDLWHGTSRR